MADQTNKSPYSKLRLAGKSILSKGSQNAKTILSGLSDDNNLQIILTSSPKIRLKLLALMPNKTKIARSIPSQEFYWTIKELGIKKTLPLLKLSSPDQIQFLFDIEWWERDSLNPSIIYKWLCALVKSGDKTISRWLKTFDFDLIVLALKHFIRVYKPYDGTDDYGESIEGLPAFTFDGVYFIEFTKKGTQDVIKRILAVLISIDAQLFRNIMEMVIWGTGAEMEEESFQDTLERLYEKGIPEFEEAITIYRPISKTVIDKMPEKEYNKTSKKKVNIQKSFYPVRIGGNEGLLISRALPLIEDIALLEDISLNLSKIANKIVIADKLLLNSHNSFKNKLAKAIGIINIGIEELSGNSESQAAKLLEKYWLENIFQIGWFKITELKKQSLSIIDYIKKSFNGGLNALDFPLMETLSGLDNKDPLYFAGSSENEVQNYRDFRSNDELIYTKDKLNEAYFISKLIKDHLSIYNIQQPQYSSYNETITLSSIFLTSYINNLINGEWVFNPLTIIGLQVFIENFTNPDKSLKISKDEAASDIQHKTGLNLTRAENKYLDNFLSSCLHILEKEVKESAQNNFLDIIAFKAVRVKHLD